MKKWIDCILLILLLLWCFVGEQKLRVPMAVFVGVVLLLSIAFGLREKLVVLPRLRREGILPEEGKATMEDVQRLVKMGRTTLAISVYRSLTGAGLKEAKEAVSKIELQVSG